MGLQVLEREKNIFEAVKGAQPKLNDYEYVLEKQLKPEARKDIIAFFADNGIVPTSMIDVSDGLSSELRHLCAASDTGCSIYQQKIPFHDETVKTAAEFHMEPLICALNGGEDYELLFTIRMDQYDLMFKRPDISIIGHITDKSSGCKMITELNQEIPLIAQGWNAYR